MSERGIDVAVLLEFFNRPSTFAKVFEQVRLARPSTLLLYQDGPREGRGDEEKIAQCRAIAESVDWPCTVYRKYQEKNVGCDPSGYIAQSWAFTLVEKCIILEDDCVPSQSFFPFCKELLDKYEFDERINIICGMNNTGVTRRIADDYLFTIRGSIWGWATWRRVAQTWDPGYTWLDDPEALRRMKAFYRNDPEFDDIVKRTHERRATGKAYFEYILGPAAWRDGRYNIVPKYNLIANYGPDEGGTHCGAGVKNMPRYVRKLFFMKTYEYAFPLKHPKTLKRDFRYEKEMTPGKLRIGADTVAAGLRVKGGKVIRALGKVARGQISLKKCFWYAVSKVGWLLSPIAGMINRLSSPSLLFGVHRLRGNRIHLHGAHVSRMKLKISGRNNVIAIGKMTELKGCRISILGDNNRITIGENTHLIEGARDRFGCYLSIGGSDNRITIGNSCYLIDVEIFEEDRNNLISVGNNSGVYNRTSLSAIEGTELRIGCNGLISSDVHFRTGDSHTLLDENGKRCNPSRNITVGDHVWIGTRAMLLKGAAVAENSVVAATALITKEFSEPNAVLAGNPARVIRRGTNWKTERI